GIGTLDTDTYGNMMKISDPHGVLYPTRGLDIVWGGSKNFPSTLILGADTNPTAISGDPISVTRTDLAKKSFWVSAPTYYNAYSAVIGGTSDSLGGVNRNVIDIGGGTS